jgi:hypothetical protein
MRINVLSELRVVDTNPEMADYTNPRGDIIREVFFLYAEYKDGARYLGPSLGVLPSDETIDKAIARAETLYRMFLLDPAKDWAEHYPVYGSSAYLDMEPELVWNERQADIHGYAR